MSLVDSSTSDGAATHLRAMAEGSLLATAIARSDDAIVITDLTPKIIYANPSAISSSGYQPDELIGQHPVLLHSGLADGRRFRQMWNVLRTGNTWRGVLVSRRKNGELFEEDTSIFPAHDRAGELTAFVAVKRDLSIQRRLEADLTRQRSARRAVFEVMRAVRTSGSMTDTAHAICREMTLVQPIDGAAILLFAPGGELVLLGGNTSLASIIPGLPACDGKVDGRLEQVAQHRLQPSRHGFSGVSCVPLCHDGKSLGVLAVAARTSARADELIGRIELVHELGQVAEVLIGSQVVEFAESEVRRSVLRDIIDRQLFHSVFQPVVEIHSQVVCGHEALTRFDDGVRPDCRFAEATLLGLGTELEVICATAALRTASEGLGGGGWLSLNLSPEVVLSGLAEPLFAATDRALVVEITEHSRIDDYAAVRRALGVHPNVRVAVDDAGAGYASLQHVLELRPAFVKLDASFVRSIDRDPARQAMMAGLRHFAARTGLSLIAEGVETVAERDTVRGLGVELAQGYLFGAPRALPVHA